MRSLILGWFPTLRVGLVTAALFVVAVASTWIPMLLTVAWVILWLGIIAVVVDTILLWGRSITVNAWRSFEDRLSNGEFNPVTVHVDIASPLTLEMTVIDELPIQLQERGLVFPWMRVEGRPISFAYEIRPVTRGIYAFGAINVFLRTRLGLVQRCVRCDAERTADVYPSIMEMRRAELATFSNRQMRYGVHRQRRLGHTMEFEKVAQYTSGDDIRTINWKATAKRSSLMVNLYQDERSQDIYSVIDLGRSMRYAHNGMTMLDHAINSTLAFSNIVVRKQDRVGLVTYDAHNVSVLPSAASAAQMGAVMKRLYSIDTNFEQSDDEMLVERLRKTIRSRSLLMLFTNIESIDAARRRLPAFRLLARSHVVVVNFFDNEAIRSVATKHPETTEGIYRQAIARNSLMEKSEILHELRRAGIHATLSSPAMLSVNAINMYLQLKARGVV
ncbi:MAG: DUF58 domain-containing protein [Ignavibacteriae bacterium]|nr:MAG: DUF58 domain-containing protein [Ignavibacteriota bacterium]